MYLIILTISTILIILIATIFLLHANSLEYMINIPLQNQPIKWKRNDEKCKYVLGELMEKVLKEYNVKKTNDKSWTILLPCTYDNIKKEIMSISIDNNKQIIFLIDNADQISSKDALWKNIVKKNGRFNDLMPLTYVLNNKDDMKLFEDEYDADKLYILKKNIQRQEGLLITKDINQIMNAKNDKYVVVQELLQNPFLINKRKINMRFYLLIICKKYDVDAYVYSNGFMYYTKEIYKPNTTSFENNITTGYIDRKVYDDNPLTHTDFKQYLDNLHEYQYVDYGKYTKISNEVFANIYKMLNKLMHSIKHSICQNNKLQNNITAQLFGVDVALDNKLNPLVIEINKGPDLGAKDKRDKELKYNVVKGFMNVLGIIQTNNLSEDKFLKIF